MVDALFDTNVLIDYLKGVPEAQVEWELYEQKSISIITWMEVMIGAKSSVVTATRDFLESMRLIPLDEEVAERAVTLRQQYRIKLPDAIIWASAETRSVLLVTRNTKDFPANAPGVRIPYLLSH